MAFPQTRLSLIDRIVLSDANGDWGHFLKAYWAPMVAFAKHRGRLSEAEAEDVVAVAVEAIISNQLLDRWHSDRSAKLRTFLCSVIRYVLNNRHRVEAGRQRLQDAWEPDWSTMLQSEAPPHAAEDVDLLYAAWVEDLLTQSFVNLAEDLRQKDKFHHFQVLYGKVSQELSQSEIAKRLNLKESAVDNHYRSVKKRFHRRLQSTLRESMAPNMKSDHLDGEIVREWSNLRLYLQNYGGLAVVLGRVYQKEVGLDDVMFQT